MGDIHTTQQLMGVRVEHAKKPGKRLGRVRHFIFHPTKRKIVGFAVKRPDAALMFHRSDIFVALDGYSVIDGVVMINDDSQSTGRAACKRLGISWDDCVIWQGLPLMTENEERLGYVGSVSFDAETVMSYRFRSIRELRSSFCSVDRNYQPALLRASRSASATISPRLRKMRPSVARSVDSLKRSSLNGKAAWRKKPALVRQLQRIRSLKQKTR